MTDRNRPLNPTLEAFTSFAISSDLGPALRQDPAYANGKNARSLVRSPELTVVVTALQKGSELKPHHSPGPGTAIVLEGEILFRTFGEEPTEARLGQHHCAVFSAGTQHSVEAIEETLLLLVIGQKS